MVLDINGTSMGNFALYFIYTCFNVWLRGIFVYSFDTNQRTNGNILFNGNIKEKIFALYSVATELIIAIPVLAAMYTTNPIIKNIYSINNQAKFSVGTFLFFLFFNGGICCKCKYVYEESSTAVMLISREGVE